MALRQMMMRGVFGSWLKTLRALVNLSVYSRLSVVNCDKGLVQASLDCMMVATCGSDGNVCDVGYG